MNESFRKKSKNLLFLDIETVCVVPSYDQLDGRMQQLWDTKATNIRNDDNLSAFDLFFKRAAIYSEFAKIICIGYGGFFGQENDELSFKVRCLQNHDERQLLLDFKKLVERYSQESLVLCAHNGKEFDFPFICRRMLVNGVDLPPALQLSGKKPWEILHQDTMEMWKFGDNKHYTALDLLAALFNVPSSKSDISGEDVSRVYHSDNDLPRIARYCKTDVIVMAQVYLRLIGLPIILPENIVVGD